MVPGISPFTWRVWQGGYEWCPHPAPFVEYRKEQLKLYPREPVIRGGYRTYDPLRQTGLFLIFAETDRTKEGILRFANKYGLLYGEFNYPRYIRPIEESPVGGDSFIGWAKQIAEMRRVVGVWSLAKRTNQKGALRTHIVWRDGGVYYQDKHYQRLIADPYTNQDMFQRFRRGDVIGPAYSFIEDVANDRLQGQVSIRVVPGIRDPELRIVPDHLAAALWLQFSVAITENAGKEFRRCPHCNGWFEVSAAAFRKNRKYCSDSCRVMAYRKRRTST